MEINKSTLKIQQLKSQRASFRWFFSCSLNNTIFRFSHDAVHLIIRLKNGEVEQKFLQEDQLKDQLQRVSPATVKVQKYKIIYGFQNEDYVFLIIELDGLQYFSFIDLPQAITQINDIFQPLRPIKNSVALKDVQKLKIMSYKVWYPKQNCVSIILVCNSSQTGQICVYQIKVGLVAEVKLLLSLKQTISSCYFAGDSCNFIVATGWKLISFQYQGKNGEPFWITKPFHLQNQMPLNLYISKIHLIYAELNERTTQKTRGINIIFYKTNPSTQELINVNKMLLKVQQSQLKVKVIYQTPLELFFSLYNKDELYIVLKDQFDQTSFVKIQTNKQIQHLQLLNNSSLFVCYEKFYQVVDLESTLQQLKMKRSSKTIKGEAMSSGSLSYSSSSSINQRRKEIFDTHKGKQSSPSPKVQKSPQATDKPQLSVFNTKKELIKQQKAHTKYQVQPPVRFQESVQKKQVKASFPFNYIKPPPMTIINSQDQNSDNQPKTPSLPSSGNSEKAKDLGRPISKNSQEVQTSPTTKLNYKPTQRTNIISFGIQQIKKENEQKVVSQPIINEFSFSIQQVKRLNAAQPQINDTKNEDQLELQVPSLTERNFSFGRQSKNMSDYIKKEDKKIGIYQKQEEKPFKRQQLSKFELFLKQKIEKFRSLNWSNYFEDTSNLKGSINLQIKQTRLRLGNLQRNLVLQSQKLIKMRVETNHSKLTKEQKEQKIKGYEEIAFLNYSYLLPRSGPKIKSTIHQKNSKQPTLQEKLWQKLKGVKLTISNLKYEINETVQQLKKINQNKAIEKKKQSQKTKLNQSKQNQSFHKIQDRQMILRVRSIILLAVQFPMDSAKPIWKLDQF